MRKGGAPWRLGPGRLPISGRWMCCLLLLPTATEAWSVLSPASLFPIVVEASCRWSEAPSRRGLAGNIFARHHQSGERGGEEGELRQYSHSRTFSHESVMAIIHTARHFHINHLWPSHRNVWRCMIVQLCSHPGSRHPATDHHLYHLYTPSGTLAINVAGAVLSKLLLCQPQRLKGPQGGQDGSSDPGPEAALLRAGSHVHSRLALAKR